MPVDLNTEVYTKDLFKKVLEKLVTEYKNTALIGYQVTSQMQAMPNGPTQILHDEFAPKFYTLLDRSDEKVFREVSSEMGPNHEFSINHYYSMIGVYGNDPSFTPTLEAFRTLLQRIWNLEKLDFDMSFPDALTAELLLECLRQTFSRYSEAIVAVVNKYKHAEQKDEINNEELFQLMRQVDLNQIKQQCEYTIILHWVSLFKLITKLT